MQVVISGSFRKHMNEIIDLKQKLEADGIQVIKPNNIDVVDNPDNPEFVKFKGEENISENDLQMQYFHGIDFCDAHIIYNKDGYIGSSALHELFYGAGRNSFAKSNGNEHTQVYLLEPLNYEQIKNSYGNDPGDDFQRIYGMINALIQMGNIKIGLDTLYEDFKIKQRIKGK